MKKDDQRRDLTTKSHSSFNDGSETYSLATGDQASERLELQNKLMGENSHEHLIKAGISKGKIVWDVGCGNGTITSYLAKSVGNTGHVYAMDVSKTQLNLAKERIELEGLKNVTFILGDIISQDNLPNELADIVYARFVLMHLKDPQIAVRKMKMLLKPSGVIVSQESIMNTCYSTYQSELFENYTNAIIALGEYNSVDYNIGTRLKEMYENQDFKKVDAYYVQQKIPAKDAKKFFALTLSECKNKAIRANIINKEKADLWETMFKNIPENDPLLNFAMARQAYVLAWKN